MTIGASGPPQKKTARFGQYLQYLLVVLGGVEPAVAHDVFYELLVVLWGKNRGGQGGGRLALALAGGAQGDPPS